MKNHFLSKASALAILLLATPAASHGQVPLDRDGDGHSDIWQVFHGIGSANGDDDSDGDGYSDRVEEIAGTDPWSAASRPRVMDGVRATNATGQPVFRANLAMLMGKRYVLQRSGELAAGSWTDVGEPILAQADGVVGVDFPASGRGGNEFFRAAISDIDEDGDGLSAFEEALIGTSDKTPNSGGTGGPSDMDRARGWVEANDPGRNRGEPLANLLEVDVAWLRSAGGGGAAGAVAEIVSVVGTGAWHQFTSWRVPAGSNPVHVFTTPPVDGHHAKVRLLGGPGGAEAPMFLTGRIRGNGDIFLSSMKLKAGGGEFVHLSTRGYGNNASVDVLEYDMAHRTYATPSGSPTSYLVATAMFTQPTTGGAKSLRVVTWRVNAGTGVVNGLADSGEIPTQTPGIVPRMRLVHLGGEEFQLSYFGANDKMVHHALRIDGAGVTESNESQGLFGHRGENYVADTQQANGLSKLTTSGYLAAVRRNNGSLGMEVWDRRPQSETPEISQPHLLTDDLVDPTPDANGIPLPVPVLTDSFEKESHTNGYLGTSMAIGDFNGDGKDDLAIGGSGRSVGGAAGAGAVYVMHGDGTRVGREEYDQTWTLNSGGVNGPAAAGDRFGFALAAGDFNGDGFDDLAIGAPGKVVFGQDSAGLVTVLYGSASGLSATGSQSFISEMLGQASSAFAYFGTVLASGDFNKDGKDDLAISSTGGRVGSVGLAGAVHVMKGAAVGLSPTGVHYFHQNRAGWSEAAETGDNFGGALAIGDFNGDGYADLAIGVPNEDLGGLTLAGVVHVVHGHPSGFGEHKLISRNGFAGGFDIHGEVGAYDRFGSSLAAGDFNGDGRDDLAIGIPGDLDNASGAVHVLGGTPDGLHPLNNRLIRRALITPIGGVLPGTPAVGERFGESLAAADLNGDGFKDLVVGVPFETVPSTVEGADPIQAAGAIVIVRGGASGLTATGAMALHQNSVDVKGAAADSDGYGDTLTGGGDFDGDGTEDVVVGIRLKDDGAARPNCGAVQVIAGSVPNLVNRGLSHEWYLQRREIARGRLTDLALENFGGKGAGRLLALGVAQPEAHAASCTKMMTLLLTVEAIEAGTISLNDEVKVSDLAGKTGGSKLATWLAFKEEDKNPDGTEKPFIQPKDKMPLRLLMAAMMNESCNRSSVAIGEHVSEKVKGSPFKIVEMMNERAGKLEMTNSVFGHPAGGWVTNPQDMVSLLREGVKHSLFVEFSSLVKYGDRPGEVLCGVDGEGVGKCNAPFAQFGTMGIYPGKVAWKGGNGRLWFEEGQGHGFPPMPTGSNATSASMVVVRRMDRSLAMGLMQTGNPDGDGQSVMEYTFRGIFTPDARGQIVFPSKGGLVGPEGPIRVTNFATDAWEGMAVTAIIDDQKELRLNLWSLGFGDRSITSAGLATHGYALRSGFKSEAKALVELAEVPGTASIADFLTANLVGDQLELKLWRVGNGFGPTGGGIAAGF